MALPISVTYTFATATSAIPLSQLDANFTTVVNGINGIGNGTNALANVLITGGTIDNVAVGATTSSTGRFSTITATTGNITTVNATTLNAATHRSDTTLTFQSNVSTTAMTIDTSQNVGIGTASPIGRLDLSIPSAGRIVFTNTGSANYLTSLNSALSGSLDLSINGNNLYLLSGGSEKARIDTSGNLLVGTTSAGGRIALGYAGLSSVGIGFIDSSATGTTQATTFSKNGTQVGSIQTSNSATSYVTSSDYRLKNSVAPMASGLATVSALKPVTYKWNADNSDGEGFIAHELQAIIPHAVTGEKDAVDANGKPIHQGVDYSKIVVHLVAAIQELKAEIDALKGAK